MASLKVKGFFDRTEQKFGKASTRYQNFFKGNSTKTLYREGKKRQNISTDNHFSLKMTSALAGFDSSILAKLEFRILGGFVGGKPENPKGNPRSKTRTNNKLNPHMAPSWNRTQATSVGGERSSLSHTEL